MKSGSTALLRGLQFLVSTRGVKRWLVPPAIASFASFFGVTWWLWSVTSRWIERAQSGAQEWTGGEPSWWRSALEWLVTKAVFLVLAKLTGFALVAALGFIAMLWTFSLVYELVSGPFLDEVHGRIEKRWFGLDPRDARERPRDIEPAKCMRITALTLAAALAWIACSLALPGLEVKLLALLLALATVGIVAARQRAWGRWLQWRAGVEARTLAASLQASAISAALLVLALPLLFVPLLGYPLFALAAGFTTAVSLLDIPMSRRRWGFSLRVSFLLHHLPAVLAFGLTASLVFMIPILGPLFMVPVASVGGLWLVCRLDKTCLRGAQ